jgi:hypothetical protein
MDLLRVDRAGSAQQEERISGEEVKEKKGRVILLIFDIFN